MNTGVRREGGLLVGVGPRIVVSVPRCSSPGPPHAVPKPSQAMGAGPKRWLADSQQVTLNGAAIFKSPFTHRYTSALLKGKLSAWIKFASFGSDLKLIPVGASQPWRDLILNSNT